jgi:hypothetical protein
VVGSNKFKAVLLEAMLREGLVLWTDRVEISTVRGTNKLMSTKAMELGRMSEWW